jgi:hypothetical protein
MRVEADAVDAASADRATCEPAPAPVLPAPSATRPRSGGVFIGGLLRSIVEDKLQRRAEGPVGPYSATPKVADETPIFGPGCTLDRDAVVSQLTQHDSSAATDEDRFRGGATIAVAAAIMDGGPEGLQRLCGVVRERYTPGLGSHAPDVPSKTREKLAELDGIESRIRSGKATHGDLSRLSELIFDGYKAYGLDDKKPDLPGYSSFNIHTGMGIAAPAGRQGGFPEFKPGESWPGWSHGTPVLFGKDEAGRDYVYDPRPIDGKPQLFFGPSREYLTYKASANNDAFAPRTRAEALREQGASSRATDGNDKSWAGPFIWLKMLG